MSKIIKRQNLQEERSSFILQAPLVSGEISAVSEAQEQNTKEIFKAEAQAQEMLATAYQEGEQKGYREGLARGLAEGKQEGLNQTADIYHQALEVLKQAEKFRANTVEKLEPEIVKLAVIIAEKIIFTKLAEDSEVITRIARQGIKLLAAPKQINILVHPQDAENLLAEEKKFRGEIPDSIPINIIMKSDLALGSCIMETDKGTIDASVYTQVKELKKVLEIA